MKKSILHLLPALCMLASCTMMHEDRDDCPYGAYIRFKYDYNLQRADMFADHVQAVRLYVFNEQGSYVTERTVQNTLEEQPLECPCFRIHLDDLPDGRYQFLAVGQTGTGSTGSMGPADGTGSTGSAGPAGSTQPFAFLQDGAPATIKDLHIHHDRTPLDTIWHGMDLRLLEVSSQRPSYDTISMVRDTKHITVSLRELDDPTQMDIRDYDLFIVDRNAHLLWDNSSEDRDTVVYLPHAVWNTNDKAADGDDAAATVPGDDAAVTVPGGSAAGSIGKMGHADFMTSRIINHEKAKDDAVLYIYKRDTDTRTAAQSPESRNIEIPKAQSPEARKPIAAVNLPDLLSRLCNYEDSRRYQVQEYLDRGYDYQLHFFLKGDRLKYVAIEISVLSWRVVINYENLGE